MDGFVIPNEADRIRAGQAETKRLARLRELAVLDTPPEPLFDDLARWASESLDMPIALISLVDESRLWVKAAIGTAMRQTDRSIAFCDHTIRQSDVMVVPDAHQDERFRRNPLVTGELAQPGIGFYAGAPIELPGGERIGTLCVIDHRPRALSREQQALLQRLAGLAAQALLMRESVTQTAWASQTRLERELAEQALALRESEQWFRDLSELSPVGVFRADAQGQVIYTNARWQEISGLTASESLRSGWAQLLFPGDLARFQQEWSDSVQQGRIMRAQYRIQRPDGSVRHLQAQSKPVFDPKGDIAGHMGVVIDVTDSVALQQRLWASQDLLDRTGAMAGVGGWELDLRTQKVTWTAQTFRIHDLPVGPEPSLADAIGFYDPSARETLEAAIQQAIQTGTSWDLELSMRTAHGRAIWVRSQGDVEIEDHEPVRLLGTFQDITHRREVAMRLQRQAHALEVLYDSSPAMLLSVSETDEVLTITQQCLRHFGWQREAVLGQPLSRQLLAEDAQRWTANLLQLAVYLGQLSREAVKVRAGDGSDRDVLLSAVVDRDPVSGASRVLIVLDDITQALAHKAELQREQRLRRQVESHAAELQRLLAERSDMLDVLAHEVRQPLNNASAALQSANAALQGTGERMASARIQRAQGVLGNVLAGVDNTLAAAALLAGQQTLHKQHVEFDVLVDLVVADLPQDARHQVVVEHLASSHGAPMDMSLIRLALRNVLLNAWRHGPARQTVVVRFRDLTRPPGSAGAAGWLIEVIDQGAGFDQQALANLFQRGGKGQRGGNGLGLYIAHRVLLMHGGQLAVLCTGPQGSTVAMTLPGHAELATIAA